MSNQPSIAIIIVGYNSQVYLKDCFDSLHNSDYQQFDIIFVDNNSSDQTVKIIEEKYPKTILIKNKGNFGFAKSNNIGFNYALKHKYDYLFILNPDTIVDSRCLSQLIEAAKTKPQTVLQPLILLHDGKKTNLINTNGNVLNYLGISFVGDYKKPQSKAQAKKITIGSGAALFLPREIIEKVGGFDEDFFMYHEDVDLSWRIHKAGFNIEALTDAIVWHKYSFSRNNLKLYYFERNRLLFLFKNFSLKYLILISPAFLLNELSVLVVALAQGWLLAKIKSYGSVIALSHKNYQKRKAVNLITRRDDHQLKALITSELNFAEINLPLKNVYEGIIRVYWAIIYRLI